MNVLITGGRGGIGRSIVEVLSARSDARVVTLGRSKPEEGVEKENVCHEVGDVHDEFFMDEVFAQHAITHVVHGAGVRTRDCERDPRLAFEGNVLSTERLLHTASRHSSVEKFIHLSTAAVYGRKEEPVDEAAALAARSAYAISKAAAELLLARGPEEPRSFATLILRPGFVLGPWSQGSLAALVDVAMRSDRVTGTFPDRFPLHWAPDLARTVDCLLEADTGAHLVLHPPAHAVRLEDLVHTLAEAVKRRGRNPVFDVRADPQAPFPTHLVCDAFRNLAGPFGLTPLADMIEKRLSAPGAGCCLP
jgi:nucleoside-diphosphate-sugar epimerase